MSLTPKRQRFVEEYPKDLNSTQAAIRAGFSSRRADATGSRLLGNVEVAAAIQQALAERSERTKIEADLVLQRLAAIAFADVRDLVSWTASTVTITPSEDLTPAQAASIAEVRRTVTQFSDEVTLKTRDSLKALELLGRHLGMFEPGASDEPPDEQPIYWQRDPRSDLRIIDQPPATNGQHSNGAT